MKLKVLSFLTLLILASCFKNTKIDTNQQLNFQRKVAINDNWKFYKGELPTSKLPKADESWESINLPHDWAIDGPFSKDYVSATGYLPGGIGWYQKELQIENFDSTRNYTLLFDGAYQNAKVWINNHFLGLRPYGYSSFYYDITKFISKNKNIITVQLDHTNIADSRWYTGNGIYRNVWLITTNSVSIPIWGIYTTTPQISDEKALVNTEIEVKNSLNITQNLTVKSVIKDASGQTVSSTSNQIPLGGNTKSKAVLSQDILTPTLWSPEAPNMYHAEISIYDEAGKLMDQTSTLFGVRDIKFTANNGFFCNGKNYKLKGVCMHHDYGALGAARTPEAIYPVLKKLKEAGTNAIRTSHNPEDPEYLTMLDTMGFFVMEEAFDEFLRGKKKWIKGRNVGQRLGINAYPEYYKRNGYSDFYEEWAQRDIQDMVKRDRNHPSIIMWSVGNETDYPNDPYQDPNIKSTFNASLPHPSEIALLVKDLAGWIKELDTTRFVTQALANTPVTNAVGVPELLDVVGYNYQEHRYETDHKKYPNRVIYGSENDDNPKAWKAVRDNNYIAGQFLWTGMDYHGEAGMFKSHSFAGGLIDYCGFEKAPYYFRKSVWTNKPMVQLFAYQGSYWAQKMHWNWNKKEEVDIICYTNCDEAELFLNGKSLGKKPLDQDNLTITWKTAYQPGTLSVKAYKSGKLVAENQLTTASKADHLKLIPTITHSEKFNYDLVQVEVNMLDANGILVPYANSNISFELEGNAEILGVCSSDYQSLEAYKASERLLYEGRCLVIIKTDDLEKLKLKVSSEELNKTFTLSF